MALATAVAAGSAARSLVLLGDPNQLPQVTQGTHPDGALRSALEHVLGEYAVIPADRGLFLPETRRLHPDLCRYVSQAFYESQLRPHASTAGQGVSAGSRLGAGARPPLSPRGARRSRGAVAGGGPARGRDRRGAAALPVDGREGPGGCGRPLLDGHLVARGRAAAPGLPVLAEPAERGGLAGALLRGGPGQPEAAGRPVQDAGADAGAERVLPAARGVPRGHRRRSDHPWAFIRTQLGVSQSYALRWRSTLPFLPAFQRE